MFCVDGDFEVIGMVFLKLSCKVIIKIKLFVVGFFGEYVF